MSANESIIHLDEVNTKTNVVSGDLNRTIEKAKNSEVMLNNFLSLLSSPIPYKLICPLCKCNTPKLIQLDVEEREKEIKRYIQYQCKCSEKTVKMELKDFIKNIEDIDTNKFKCYKHKDLDALILCEECNKYMCERCEEYHKDFQENHKVKTIKIN